MKRQKRKVQQNRTEQPERRSRDRINMRSTRRSTVDEAPRRQRTAPAHKPSANGRTPGTPSRGSRLLWRFLRGDGWAILLTLVLAGWGFWYVMFGSGSYTIETITTNETHYIPQEVVDGVVTEFFDTQLLGFISRKNSWVLRERRAARHIEEQLTVDHSIESVHVTQPDNHTVVVSIQERVPQLTWVTTSEDGVEHFYYIDRYGVVAQELAAFGEVDQSLPRVRDDNRGTLGLSWEIMSSNYIGWVLALHEQFTEATGVAVDSYIFPETNCERREFVAEKVYQQQLLDEASDEFREKKRQIQEQFAEGLITIDQSIDLLEDIKNEELGRQGEDEDAAFERFEWQVVYTPIECDYVKVATELHVSTTGETGGYTVKMDVTEDMTVQLENMVAALRNAGRAPQDIQYIDVRILDRAYIK